MMSLRAPLTRHHHCTHRNFQAITARVFADRQSGTWLVSILTGLGIADVLAGRWVPASAESFRATPLPPRSTA